MTQRHPADRQARPAGPRRPLSARPGEGRYRVRRRRHAVRQPAHHRHHGPGRRGGGEGDLSRTKAALAARKARGLPLGNPATFALPIPMPALARARTAWSKKAAEHATMVLPAIQQIRATGASLRETANEMTARNFTTIRGGRWTAAQVSAVLRRANGDPVKETA